MISNRLKSLVKYVNVEDKVIDIGCDHALLDIYLVKNNIVNNVLISDISKNALEQGIDNIKKYNLESNIENGNASLELEKGSLTNVSKSNLVNNTSSNNTLTDTTSQNEKTILTSKGNIGISSSAELLDKWRKVIINIDELIINECYDLFMRVY